MISLPSALHTQVREALLRGRISECRGLKGPVDVATRWPMNPALVSGTIDQETIPTFLPTCALLADDPKEKNTCIVNGGWNLLYDSGSGQQVSGKGITFLTHRQVMSA